MALILTLDLCRFDVITDRFGTSSVDLTPNTKSCSQDLEHSALQFFRQAFFSHSSCNLENLIQRNRLGVLDVLLFLLVPGRFLERPDHERGCRGDDGDGGLSILDGKLDGDS